MTLFYLTDNEKISDEFLNFYVFLCKLPSPYSLLDLTHLHQKGINLFDVPLCVCHGLPSNMRTHPLDLA